MQRVLKRKWSMNIKVVKAFAEAGEDRLLVFPFFYGTSTLSAQGVPALFFNGPMQQCWCPMGCAGPQPNVYQSFMGQLPGAQLNILSCRADTCISIRWAVMTTTIWANHASGSCRWPMTYGPLLI